MRKIKLVLTTALILLMVQNSVFAISANNKKEIVKITKKMCKLSNNNKIDELGEYYSDNYKSFDGYGKKQILEIYKITNELYPNSKSKEKITKIEEKDNLVTVYIDEKSKTKVDVTGENAIYALKDKIKGEMKSISTYSITFNKENENWKVIKDEIYSEETRIRYGEAIKTDFEMETPDKLKEGEEFTVKTTLKMPTDRIAVGSIGHDKIIYPPKKYFDPYRSINESGILERVMIANKDGKNEYANSTFALIVPRSKIKSAKEKENTNAAITGMGIFIKRINLDRKEVL